MIVPASMGDLGLGWREGLLVLILALVVYMVLLVWRMRRVGQRKETLPPLMVEPRVSQLDNLGAEIEPSVSQAVPEVSWDAGDARFAQDAFMEGVGRELDQLREEVDALRGALAALRGEVQGLRENFEHETLSARTAHNASPLYSDAMQMALLGHDPVTISERCGIARAEAELVVALVKNKDS